MQSTSKAENAEVAAVSDEKLPAPEGKKSGSTVNVVLWVVQGLLALLFLFAGVSKFITPVATMNQQMGLQLPGLFLHFIGACEVLGALGLILPGLLRIRPLLTPLAAAGLVIIMIGATVLTLVNAPIANAAIPLVTGLLAAWVAYARWRKVPLGRSAEAPAPPTA